MSMRNFLSNRWGILLICTLAIAGCLSIPLGDPDKSTVDSKLIGWWEQADPGQGDRALFSVQAYDAHTFLVMHYGYAGDVSAVTPKGSLIYKAWLTPIGDARFLTMEVMSPVPSPEKQTEKDRYAVLRIEQIDGGWSARPVSDDFLKDCATPEALRQKISDNLNDDALYSEPKPVAYHKASGDLAQSVLKAFNQGG